MVIDKDTRLFVETAEVWKYRIPTMQITKSKCGADHSTIILWTPLLFGQWDVKSMLTLSYGSIAVF